MHRGRLPGPLVEDLTPRELEVLQEGISFELVQTGRMGEEALKDYRLPVWMRCSGRPTRRITVASC